MMLDEGLQEALNRQINLELYAAYTYLSMSSHLQSLNMLGFSAWLRKQSGEEREHAMRIYDYIHERGGRVTLLPIEQPPAAFDTIEEVFQMALEHEQRVTRSIHDLYQLATQEGDYPTQVMLQWFVEEQVEEESNADYIISQLKLVGSDRAALFMLDRELAKRHGEKESETN